MNRRGTKIRFRPDAEIFGEGVAFKPNRIFRMARAKAYLFGGVEIRWSCAPELLKSGDDTPEKAVFHFPGGLKDFLSARIDGAEMVTKDVFAGKVEREGGHGSVEWAVAWLAEDDGFLSSYCNTVPTPDGGTHEAGLRAALIRGLKGYGELTNNKKAAQITAEDVLQSAATMLSVFIREPEFQGQTKDKLSSQEATRIVEMALRDEFDHWLTASPVHASRLLDWVINRAEERLRRKREKEVNRKTATRKLRLPGKLAGLLPGRGGRHRNLHRRGRLGRRLRQAGARPQEPGHSALARQNPERRQRLLDEAVAEPAHRRSGAGARLRHRQELSRGRSALREGRDHDRRRRRRRAYRLAADHLLLHADARADRGRPSLSRGAAAL